MNASTGFAASVIVAAMIGLVAASSAYAVPIILNGGFESGLTGWIRANQIGSAGNFFLQTGTLSPELGDPVPAPPEGTRAAMSDAAGPGAHVLYQDFVATADAATLSFALFIGNRALAFFTPSSAVGLDFSTPALNQQARVDIIRSTAGPFSVAAADVFLNLYQTKPGDPPISGYTTVTTPITALLAAHVGETLRLRFAETDNLAEFQMGVDNVRFAPSATVPEPASMLLFGAALAALVGSRRNRSGRERA